MDGVDEQARAGDDVEGDDGAHDDKGVDVVLDLRAEHDDSLLKSVPDRTHSLTEQGSGQHREAPSTMSYERDREK
jgi:hypothetical protein